MSDSLEVTVRLTPLDFNPHHEGASSDRGIKGHIPSRPGRAAVPYDAYFESRGEPGIVFRVGRRRLMLPLRELVAETDALLSPLPAAFVVSDA